MKNPIAILSAFLISAFCWSQKPAKPTSAELFHQIQKLNFLGSVLYIAAHPDDENTKLISYMANHQNARTAYLSLTRGDGGQNLIGTELRELLGVIRTQELIEARKIDGGEQFFTRANDFGFSKIPDETLKIWNKNQVLEDMVYLVRKFKPDVIINRFDHRSPGTTHGHHTSSALLSTEVFDMAANPAVFPEQLSLVSVWQPKRLYFNQSIWFYGGKDKFDKADKSNLTHLETGVYSSLSGKSNQEIASLSRSKHQSQGFGSTPNRGEDIEYLEFVKGNAPQHKNNLFEGIDTSWNRIKNGTAIAKILYDVEKNFDFKNPAASIPKLIEAYKLIKKIEDKHWRTVKTEEIEKIIYGCAGLFLEGVAEQQSYTPGSNINVKTEVINRSNTNIELLSVSMFPINQTKNISKKTENNKPEYFDLSFTLPENTNYTSPYWLEKEGTNGMYRVDELEKTGLPDIIRNVKLRFELLILGEKIGYEKDVIYKYNDPVKGETYKPLDIVPEVSVAFTDKVVIFRENTMQKIGIKVKSGQENISGIVQLNLPNNWKVSPEKQPFNFNRKGSESVFYFEVIPDKNASETEALITAVSDKKHFDKEQIIINYDHISQQQILLPAKAKFIPLDIKTNGEKIAYIMGAGDDIPQYLRQMGYEVKILNPKDITAESLKAFQTIIMGIRAYNTVEELAFKQSVLLEHVKNGNTMIVQYNTNGKLVTQDMSPYTLKISRDRVTEEDAEVRFLAPKHKILNHPNLITKTDFSGWVQEQGLYYPNEWGKEFTPILSSNDTGEEPKNGALLIAPYGKGYYIYTGLSFFRELPAGVPGAFRLFANMISINSVQE